MAPIGNHSFRATGITAYLANGGTLEHAQSMAAHERHDTHRASRRNALGTTCRRPNAIAPVSLAPSRGSC
jgi:hypothetical protein